MIVKVISIPPGEAPDWVRQHWVGCILYGKFTAERAVGIISERSEGDICGIVVDINQAIETLGNHNGDAHAWFLGWRSKSNLREFIFPLSCCEILEA